MQSVGQSVIRKDAYEKATGRSKFAADYNFTNQLYGKAVTSPFASAKIKKIDIAAALSIPGVKAVLTYKNIPGKNIVPLVLPDMPFLAENDVKFYGEAVALIAADTFEAAIEAAKKIKIEYKTLKPVLTIKESIKQNKILKEYKIIKGDINKGFKEADFILENEYHTPYQEHAYLETNGMVAELTDNGTMTVLGSMQCPFYVHDAVSQILGFPQNKVQIIQAATGGGFGGKEDVPSLYAGWASLLAYHTKRPVKIILSREEDLIFSSKRHPGYIKYKTGFKKDGSLTAIDVEYYLNGGAYATLSPIVMWRGLIHAAGPYKCDNVKVKAAAMMTNLVPCGAFRGFGTPQVLFAHESQMDIIAHKLNIDPADIRKKNILRKGDATSTNQILTESVGMESTLDAALKDAAWQRKKETFAKENEENPSIKKGIGISTVFYGVGLGAGGKHLARAGTFVQVYKDGSIVVSVGTTEMGQGMTTVLSQIAAEVFGIDYANVRLSKVDTTRVPDSGPTVASRATFMSGNSILDACAKIKERMTPVAEEMLCKGGVPPLLPHQKLIWKNNLIYPENNPENKISFADLVKECACRRVHLTQQGWYKPPETNFDHETGLGDVYFVYSYATNIAEVEVNAKTFEVTVKKLTAAHDMGRAINPILTEGQIQGGVLQGIGYALTEEILHKDGIMLNPNFSTYIIPTIHDAPVINPIIIEENYSHGPFGAKGFGELPLMGVAPAVANAVFNATGIRMLEIPITPERLMKANQNK